MSEETKRTRTKRVVVTEALAFKPESVVGKMEFTLPSGHKEVVKLADMTACFVAVLEYGLRQKFQDHLARGKDEPAATDAEAHEMLDSFRSGIFASGRESGPPTMESVARRMIKANNKTIGADALAASVAKVLDSAANPRGYYLVEDAYKKALAAWEAARASKATLADLGLE